MRLVGSWQNWTSALDERLRSALKAPTRFKIVLGPRTKERTARAIGVLVRSSAVRSGPPPEVGRIATGFEWEADARL
jgi:hypothetical protein